MPQPVEGYVLHAYGSDRYAQHAVASVMTLRRHDETRPVALYCSEDQRDLLERYGLDTLFEVLEVLPEAHRSIVGFKHYLHRFMPFDRNLFVDADMVWCRNPDPLWRQLSAFDFTATGQARSDFFFGGPKGLGIVADYVLDRRRTTMRKFGLTHLPRVQAGMIYAADVALTREVCDLAAHYLSRQDETHFRSRLNEGRTEESCEWSMAMAMSHLHLPIFPWFQGFNSPQLDFIEGLATYDDDFDHVSVRYYSDAFVYSLRGLPNHGLRDVLISFFSRLPGRGDYMNVTPYVLHFGWLNHKQPFFDYSERTWARVTEQQRSAPTHALDREPVLHTNGTSTI